jgi:hypothetical protein
MKRRHLVPALAAALALAACTSRDAKIATVEVPRPDQTLGGNIAPKSYEIPAGHAAEIRRLFKSGGAMGYPVAVVSAQGTQTQFVNPQPVFIGENRFVVALPEQHHAALEQVVAQLRAAGAPSTPSNYETTYWIVEATPADDTTVMPDLEEIAGTLKELGALGKRKFRLVDRIGGRTTDGDESSLQSVRSTIKQTLSADSSGLQLALELEQAGAPENKGRGPFVRTTLRLHPDKPVVLGDSSLSQPVATVDGILLYVVRARRVD